MQTPPPSPRPTVCPDAPVRQRSTMPDHHTVLQFVQQLARLSSADSLKNPNLVMPKIPDGQYPSDDVLERIGCSLAVRKMVAQRKEWQDLVQRKWAFLLSRHPHAGQTSLVPCLVDDVLEIIVKNLMVSAESVNGEWWFTTAAPDGGPWTQYDVTPSYYRALNFN